MNVRPVRAALVPLLAALLSGSAAEAISIRDYGRLTSDQKSVYLAASVSMTSYLFAVNGQKQRGQCFNQLFFGPDAKGPNKLATEIAAAEQIDPDKLQLEGVVLGVADRYCPEALKK